MPVIILNNHMLILSGPFSMFEKFFPEIVTTDSNGRLTGQVIDFCKPTFSKEHSEHIMTFQAIGNEWKCARCLKQQSFPRMFG